MAKARPQSRSSLKTAKKPAAPKAARKKAPAKKVPAKKKPQRKAAANDATEASPAAAKQDERNVFGVEVEPGSVEKTLAKVREELTHWVNKGRYTKVRFMLRGKPILPDLPVAAVVAAEAVTFWWAGLLRALLVTVGAGTLLKVELVNDADREVAYGRQCLLAGDLDKAVEAFQKALSMDRDNPAALLSMGITCKLKQDLAKAREYLQRVEQVDHDGPSGQEAARLLDQMNAAAPAAPAQQ
ncbi:MAG: tetratricopeptide repeat protein [Myxococcales bacterium]